MFVSSVISEGEQEREIQEEQEENEGFEILCPEIIPETRNRGINYTLSVVSRDIKVRKNGLIIQVDFGSLRSEN